MNRRRFIKNSAICSAALCIGCGGTYFFNKNHESEIIPTSVKLEPCTLCNLSCPCCWRSTIPNSLPLGYLKFVDFKKFIDKNPFIKNIDFTGQGEMFLNPDLNKILKYAHEKNINISVDSNFNILSDEIAELLVTTKFGNLSIALDGASPQTYSIYRRGGDFNKVIDNIKKVQFYQKKHNDLDHPNLIWKFILFGHNEHEIPKAKQMAQELGLPITFALNYEPTYSPLKNLDFVKKETGIDVQKLTTDSKDAIFDIHFKNYLKTGNGSGFCPFIFDNPLIFYDGTFIGCCNGVFKKKLKTNVFELGLKNAYKTKEIKKIIDVFAMKADSKGTMCEDCEFLTFMKKRGYKITQESHNKIKKI